MLNHRGTGKDNGNWLISEPFQPNSIIMNIPKNDKTRLTHLLFAVCLKIAGL